MLDYIDTNNSNCILKLRELLLMPNTRLQQSQW